VAGLGLGLDLSLCALLGADEDLVSHRRLKRSFAAVSGYWSIQIVLLVSLRNSIPDGPGSPGGMHADRVTVMSAADAATAIVDDLGITAPQHRPPRA
jgi:hypothetical protein